MAIANRKSKQTIQLSKNPNVGKHTTSVERVKSTKSISFNEENILETRYAASKHQGSIRYSEIRTPYPKPNDGVDSILLRKKMVEYVGNMKNREIRGSINTPVSVSDVDFEHIIAESLRNISIAKDFEEETFEAKRKKFYAAEYILTQQRALSDVVHGAPGPRYRDAESIASKMSFKDASVQNFLRHDRDEV